MSNFTPAQRDWIDALRSGEYTQCKGAMIKKTRSGSSHCCLGVAGDRYIKSGGTDVVTVRDSANNYGFKDPSGWFGVYAGADLPPAVEEHLNLRLGYHTLAGLNDSGSTFGQIADELEAHPEKYFTNFNS